MLTDTRVRFDEDRESLLASLAEFDRLARVAGVVDAHGHLHSPNDGRFIDKPSVSELKGITVGASTLTRADFASGTTVTLGLGYPDAQIREQLHRSAARRVAARWDVSPEDLEEAIREDGSWDYYQDKAFDERKREFAESQMWAWDSAAGKPVAMLAILGAARQAGVEFELSDREKAVAEFARSHPGVDRATASLGRAMYAETQAWFAERGIRAVEAKRATMSPHLEATNLYTSWALRGESGFIQMSDEHKVVESAIPVERIFSIPPTGLGSYEEAELVVMASIAPRAGGPSPADDGPFDPDQLAGMATYLEGLDTRKDVRAVLDDTDEPFSHAELKQLAAHFRIGSDGTESEVRERLIEHVSAGKKDAVQPLRPPAPKPETAPTSRRGPKADEIRSAMAGGFVGEPVHLSGSTTGKVTRLRATDGTELVHKEYADDDIGTRWTAAESLSASVGKAIGAPVPELVADPAGPTSFYQPFIGDSAVGMELDRDLGDAYGATPEGTLLGILDHLIANDDRHDNNWLVSLDGQHITGIDHGTAFAQTDGDKPVVGQSISPMRFVGQFINGDQWIDNPLSPADIAAMRPRLEALRAEFESQPEPHRQLFADAYVDMMRRFEQIAAHATGTKRLLGADYAG